MHLRRRNVLLAVVAVILGIGIVMTRPWGSDEDVVASLLAERRQANATSAAPAESLRDAPANLATLMAALEDTSWRARLSAARTLASRDDIPSSRRAEALLGALEREVSRPTLGSPPVGSYLPTSSFIRLHLAQMLGELGTAALRAVRNAASRKQGDTREWALVALGFAGANDVAPQLRDLVRSSRDPAARMSAAHLLGELKDRQAIPILETALADSFSTTVGRDDRRGDPPRPFFPVREQAVGALEALGMRVERVADNTFRVIQ